MESLLKIWFNRRFPQNYIIQNPFRGSAILAVFTFVFAIAYQPLHSHASASLSYGVTMSLYSVLAAIAALIFIFLIRSIPYFSGLKEWTLSKELLAIIIILAGMGTGIYLAAFLIEPPAPRWNIATFWDSCKNAFLVGILPFSFFTIINLNRLPGRYQFMQDTPADSPGNEPPFPDKLIQIESSLKKERLTFYPDQFLYAESDGNYVVFHLKEEKGERKKIIRNSISEIEEQLSGYPAFVRTHRSFIVNIKKVKKKQGNASGYRLTLEDVQESIPVSRNNIDKLKGLLEFSG
ncbi:MAG TPA: LytTR family DNA-binding domain-containing protein [Bacteroidales bacterium]|nr:LytTR family DNA-binding domain-containing protein [Bacteroidales bacterium]